MAVSPSWVPFEAAAMEEWRERGLKVATKEVASEDDDAQLEGRAVKKMEF